MTRFLKIDLSAIWWLEKNIFVSLTYQSSLQWLQIIWFRCKLFLNQERTRSYVSNTNFELVTNHESSKTSISPYSSKLGWVNLETVRRLFHFVLDKKAHEIVRQIWKYTVNISWILSNFEIWHWHYLHSLLEQIRVCYKPKLQKSCFWCRNPTQK